MGNYFLIPTELILKVIKDRLVGTFDDILDYFYITEKFLLHKLRFMAKEKMKWFSGLGKIMSPKTE